METTTLKMFSDTIRNENGLILITPVCELFNLHVQNQYSKIKKDPILGKLYGKNHTDSAQNEKLYGKNTTEFGEIDKNGRIFLTKKGFLRWIQIINPNTLEEELREKFIMYQEMISDFLFGSLEEHETITRVNHELQQWKQRYSEAGTMVKKKQAELILLLNTRYQYRIEFNQNKTLSK
ncbi:MAG: hypothetical protein HQ522_21810 [Bacteroidetes bacterium]|nr:hypothetical protein [Bacteroidota bacterium]